LASPNTRAAYRNDLAVFVAWCEARQVSPLHATTTDVERFRSDLLAAGSREGTVSRRASAVQSFLRGTRGPDAHTESGVAHGASSTVLLSDDERARLLSVLPGQSAKAQVLIGLLLLDGLKLDEILDLDVPNVSGRLPNLDVSVTRDAAAQLFTLHPTTSTFLHDHLSDRCVGPLLTGRADDTRLTRFGADYLVKRAGRDAGLDAPLTTNALRRAYVSHAHEAGEGVDDIRHRVGHQNVRTTRRLLAPFEDAPGRPGSIKESPVSDRR
jgi:site-specific recombinase XerD